MLDLGVIYYIYLFAAILFIILDNKDASSTIAWIAAFAFLPGVSVVFYVFFGRNWKTATRKRKLTKQFFERNLMKALMPLIKRQENEIKKLKTSGTALYNKELIELIFRNSNQLLTSKNKVDVLENGNEKFNALINDLRNAKKFIHMEYYIWRSDNLGKKIKDILIKKASEGVEVRILYDALGSMLLSSRYVKELRENGVKIYPYFNFLSPLKIHTLNYRNHRKIAVIDGKIGYTGGMNIGQEYIDGGKKFKFWRDTHLRIEGEAVSLLQAVFATSWHTTTEEKLFDKQYYPLQDGKDYCPMQITTSGPDSEWNSIQQLY